jgi:hypothetical protein
LSRARSRAFLRQTSAADKTIERPGNTIVSPGRFTTFIGLCRRRLSRVLNRLKLCVAGNETLFFAYINVGFVDLEMESFSGGKSDGDNQGDT